MRNPRVIRIFSVSIILLFAILSVSLTLFSQGKDKSKKDESGLTSAIVGGLKFRSIGPAAPGGRISSIAVDPRDKNIVYFAAASGGVWKSVNGGTTFSPIFEGEKSYSIGVVAIDPSNTNVVWVGTGENNSQRSVGYGDGIYRSEDGGKSWKNMGLKNSDHIARILFDPRNTNTVYAAAQGPLWGPGGDRGLFKTTDGGKTWKNILSISDNTGVSDVVMDPKNPDVLIASAYQRRRHVWTLIDGGPESAIHRSTDGGQTWAKITSGLPNVEMGRIGLGMSPVDPRVVYAVIEAADRKGGIFRSTDEGVSWEKRNDFDETAMYYGTLFCDPANVDRIYVMNFMIMVSNDGGATLKAMSTNSKHVDNHVIWIDPADPRHYLVGCDGGLYESFDRGESWLFHNNFVISQFYDVDVDNSTPFYYVYGGTQDNASVGGPSRTRSQSGITNTDWFVTWGGDGFQSRIDPEDPNTVYSEAQYGDMCRFDRRTGEAVGIQPKPAAEEMQYHWNWDTPILISPHSHTRLYVGSDKLFRSEDRGDTWTLIDDELTRGIDRDKLPVMGKVWGPDAVSKHASTSLYGNAIAISESPKQEGLLFVGTDDGVINITEDGGKTWRKELKFPGVPETTYVCRVLTSQFDANTVYASFDNHKKEDFKPYLLKSNDAGHSWKSIASNLPDNGPVLAIAEDFIEPNLLFVGTEFGLFVTTDGGGAWVQMKSGLPTIPVRDIAIQKRENDLVLATFGRGFYILDNYSPLRALTREALAKESILFPVKDAKMYIESQPLGGKGKAALGDNFFVADNPPFGATFTYYLKDGLKSLKDKRKDAETEADKKKETLPYPTMDQLRAEDEEEAPSIILSISDAEGNVVRTMTGPAGKGLNRIAWNLRYPAPSLDDDNGGPLVMPGNFQVSVAKRVNGVLTQLAGPVPFRVALLDSGAMSPDDRKTLADFQQKVDHLQRAVSGALAVANDVHSRLGQIRKALMETPSHTESLLDSTLAIDARVRNILRNLRGDPTTRNRSEDSRWSISERVGSIMDDERGATCLPTHTHLDGYKVAGADFVRELSRLHVVMDVDLPNLQKAMNAAGSPWTPGRLPDWKME